MHIAIVCELADILAVDLQLLAAHGIPWPVVSAARLGSLCTPRTERVEEFVLTFGWMRAGGGARPGVLFLEVIPLVLSVHGLGCASGDGWIVLLVCSCFVLRGRRCRGGTSRRGRRCRQCRRATRVRSDAGRWKSTRPEGLTRSW